MYRIEGWWVFELVRWRKWYSDGFLFSGCGCTALIVKIFLLKCDTRMVRCSQGPVMKIGNR